MKQSKNEEEHTEKIHIGMLEEQFNRCNLKVFKESPMVDDTIEGWLDIVRKQNKWLYDIESGESEYHTVSHLLKRFYPKKFQKEFEAICKFVADENNLICITELYELDIWFQNSAPYFFKCITMKYSDYRKIANLVEFKDWVRAADELRECVHYFQENSNNINNRGFLQVQIKLVNIINRYR